MINVGSRHIVRVWLLLVLLAAWESPSTDAFHPATICLSRPKTVGRYESQMRWSLNGFRNGSNRGIRNHFCIAPLLMYPWEGDDMRWSSKFRRRLKRHSLRDNETPVKTTIILLQTILFLYQTIATVNFIRLGHPSYWPSHALTMISDAVLGTSVAGPLAMDFGFSNSLSQNQPHRYLTSGFFHGGIFHLAINLYSLTRQPAWLETGLGTPLYITTFLVSIVTGNMGHAYGVNNPFDRTLCLGASGGLCGLYGLMYVSLLRMRSRRATRLVIGGLGVLFLSGLFFESISTMSHIGGFIGGVLMAILFSPSYKKNYSLRRKNSTEYDPAPRDFRQAMGFGVLPTQRGLIPISVLWGTIAVAFALSKPKFKAVPSMIVKGLLSPGSLMP